MTDMFQQSYDFADKVHRPAGHLTRNDSSIILMLDNIPKSMLTLDKSLTPQCNRVDNGPIFCKCPLYMYGPDIIPTGSST